MILKILCNSTVITLILIFWWTYIYVLVIYLRTWKLHACRKKAHRLRKFFYMKKIRGLADNWIKLSWVISTHGNWKNQNLGSHFGATSKTALPMQPIHLKNEANRLDRQGCLDGSSKTALRNLIFSIAMGADYSLELYCIVS